jgi:hypothetical protein
LASYELANGLRVTTLIPNDRWHIQYDDGDGTSVDVTYQALMPPFDIHDPAMDPITAAQHRQDADDQSDGQGGFAWGTAYNGHFDQTGHYSGEVSLRGRRIPIDCTSTMDHSWGPRAERGGPNMSWLHAHFSDDYAIHAIFSFDETRGGRDLELAHGYVLRDGTVHGLAAGHGVTIRDAGFYARTIELDVTDAAGDTHHLTGRGLTRFPWQAWPNMVGFNVLAQWQSTGPSGGRTGYGEIQDFVDLTRLTSGQAFTSVTVAG